MGNYVEQNLNRNEQVVKNAEMNPVTLVFTWVVGILFCWLLLIPVICALITTVRFLNTELAITNKRIVGKVGVTNSKSLDAPLNKIQSVSVQSGLMGKIFNYGTVSVKTGGDDYQFAGVKNANAFKSAVMAQIDQYEEDKIREQAEQMAKAMTGALDK